MRDDEYLYQWVVYYNSSDFPGKFVVRRWRISPGLMEHETAPWAVSEHLDEARASLPPGLFCMERQPDDVPAIVEVWL